MLVTLAAWAGAVVRGGFAFDDREAIEGNPVVEGALPATEAFRRDYWHHVGDAGHYRPLAALALRLDRAAYGERAFGFHLTNALLHAAVVLLAGLALARAPGGAALLVGLLPFAAHPVLADSVAWISGRTSMVSGLGGAGLLLVAARARAQWAAASLAGAALLFGLLGKEDAVVFLPPAVLLAWWRAPRLALAVAGGGAVAVATALALRAQALGSALPAAPHAPLAALGLADRLPFAGRALLELVRLLAWPFDGPPTYRAAPGFTPADPPGATALLGWLPWLAAVGAGALALARRRPADAALPAVAAGFAALALLPVLQVIPAGEVFAPRFLYAPLLLAAPLFGRLLGFLPRAALVALALACVAGAWHRAGVYGGRASYAREVLAHVPADAAAWNDLALAQEEEGRVADARATWLRATELHPRYSRPWSNLGRLALARGELARAVELFERAVAVGPGNPVAEVNLASALLRSGDPSAAVPHYRRATELAPGLGPAWRGLGQALLEAGRTDEARTALERALALDPRDGDARRLRARVDAASG